MLHQIKICKKIDVHFMTRFTQHCDESRLSIIILLPFKAGEFIKNGVGTGVDKKDERYVVTGHEILS